VTIDLPEPYARISDEADGCPAWVVHEKDERHLPRTR
jgi:hypothetical protein